MYICAANEDFIVREEEYSDRFGHPWNRLTKKRRFCQEVTIPGQVWTNILTKNLYYPLAQRHDAHPGQPQAAHHIDH